jgi:hypothetical protein
MQKEIKYKEGKFLIGFCDNSQDISVYKNGTYSEPIRVTFIPNVEMTEQKCSTYTSENMKRITAEVKTIISENKLFYDNFEITFNNEFTGYSLYRHHLNRDLLIVSDSSMHINWKLKNSILQ